MVQITPEHLVVLMDPHWQCAQPIIGDLISLDLWDDRNYQRNMRGRQLVAEILVFARAKLNEIKS